jgi:hypothetical protein
MQTIEILESAKLFMEAAYGASHSTRRPCLPPRRRARLEEKGQDAPLRASSLSRPRSRSSRLIAGDTALEWTEPCSRWHIAERPRRQLARCASKLPKIRAHADEGRPPRAHANVHQLGDSRDPGIEGTVSRAALPSFAFHVRDFTHR